MTDTTKSGPRPSDKYIPLYFVAFFVVLAILDGIFVYLATKSHTGVIEQNHYQRGLEYNDRVAAAEAQSALGWQSDISLTEDKKLLFKLTGKDNTPLESAQVRAQFIRPTQEGRDFVIDLSEIQGGLYVGEPASLEKGMWDIRVYVTWKQQQYQSSKRIVVQNP